MPAVRQEITFMPPDATPAWDRTAPSISVVSSTFEPIAAFPLAFVAGSRLNDWAFIKVLVRLIVECDPKPFQRSNQTAPPSELLPLASGNADDTGGGGDGRRPTLGEPVDDAARVKPGTYVWRYVDPALNVAPIKLAPVRAPCLHVDCWTDKRWEPLNCTPLVPDCMLEHFEAETGGAVDNDWLACYVMMHTSVSEAYARLFTSIFPFVEDVGPHPGALSYFMHTPDNPLSHGCRIFIDKENMHGFANAPAPWTPRLARGDRPRDAMPLPDWLLFHYALFARYNFGAAPRPPPGELGMHYFIGMVFGKPAHVDLDGNVTVLDDDEDGSGGPVGRLGPGGRNNVNDSEQDEADDGSGGASGSGRAGGGPMTRSKKSKERQTTAGTAVARNHEVGKGKGKS